MELSDIRDGFRWIDAYQQGDVEVVLSRLDQKFTRIPSGFSIGSGRRLFPDYVDSELLEQVATIGKLTAYIESHLQKDSNDT